MSVLESEAPASKEEMPVILFKTLKAPEPEPEISLAKMAQVALLKLLGEADPDVRLKAAQTLLEHYRHS